MVNICKKSVVEIFKK